MTAELPAPLSMWREKTTGLLFAVSLSEPAEIVAINTVATWAGSPERFAREFEPLHTEGEGQ